MNPSDIFDLYFVICAVPDNDIDAWSEFWQLIRGRSQVPRKRRLWEKFLEFYAGFYLRFPGLFPPHVLVPTKEIIKDRYLGPHGYLMSILRVPIEYADEVLRFALVHARTFNITIFDLNSRIIYRVDGFDGILMRLEYHNDFLCPNFRQICDAVDSMTPRRGPSTLVLDQTEEVFAQAAGGDGKYTCEWREVSDQTPRHWVAGTSAVVQGEVSIPTHGYHVLVNSNECLSAEDVKSILGAFARKEPRPKEWVWRDITDRFK